MKNLTHERLRELLDYDPETGIFRWRIGRPGTSAGTDAGCVYQKHRGSKSYLVITVGGQRFQNAGRLAWFWMTGALPEYEIDHKNRDPLDNSWANLRHATSSQNKMNQSLRRDNACGHTGLIFIPSRKKWRVGVGLNRRNIHIGYFDTREEASAAYDQAIKVYHGEFARVA